MLPHKLLSFTPTLILTLRKKFRHIPGNTVAQSRQPCVFTLFNELACIMLSELQPLKTSVLVLEGAFTMPWYCDPATTCKVLNRIVDRYPCASTTDLNAILGSATQILWDKQERYYNKMKVENPAFTSDDMA